MPSPLKVYFPPGDGAGWALDEDLRQIRTSLVGRVAESRPAGADVIHAPFWQNLKMVAPEILRRAFVIAHADNPPFFYLKQAEFATGQAVVDLWVARSAEAARQFQQLGLPVEHIPYTIDPSLFFPIPDKRALRREFGLPEDAYLIANFHRDTEGADLRTPKFQKAPELMVEVVARLHETEKNVHVLLAGPRRHWIRAELARRNIPFTFVGKPDLSGDDFGVNILQRSELNKLYNAADVYLIPSRWEGGPQSAMEAAACRCKVASVPLGVGRDILEEASQFRTVGEAVEILTDDVRNRALDATLEPQFQRFLAAHTTGHLQKNLQSLYATLEGREDFQKKAAIARPAAWISSAGQLAHTIRRRATPAKLPRRACWNHSDGHSPALDGILRQVRECLESWGVEIVSEGPADVEIVGWPFRHPVPGACALQFLVPGGPSAQPAGQALLIAPAVQDVVNLRSRGIRNPAVVIPFLAALPAPPEDQPLVVEPDDGAASLRVWAALASGCPVVYPADSAYYEQVFHAGIAYGEIPDRQKAEATARSSFSELVRLIRIPTAHESASLLRKVLSTL